MALKSNSKLVRLLGGLCLAAAAVPGVAHAASYSDLVAQGYRTSTLTKSRGGSPGWIVSGGGKKYFCRLGASVVLSGKNGMVSITSSGRQIRLNKSAYEKATGGSDASLPHLENLKAGRPRPRDVRSCVTY